MLLYRTLVTTVSSGDSRLSLEVSHPTCRTAYEPFTPNKSGQRLHPTCHRGCWHVVGRCFFCRYRLFSSRLKGVYNPRAFIPHAALLRQAFAHCASMSSGDHAISRGYPVLALLSEGYPGLRGRFLTCYSPVRH
jgi:hypothetical protein